MRTSLKTNQQGFTLVEIAIVLVIIGLLLGAVFKGQELIGQAKVKNATKQLDEVRAAYYTHIDKKNTVPGDAGGDGITDGDSNFWPALYRENLLNGDPNAATVVGPNNPYGVTLFATGSTANYVCSKLPQNAIVQIETKYDDNNGQTGSYIYVGATKPTAGNDPTAAALPATPGDTLAWMCSKL